MSLAVPHTLNQPVLIPSAPKTIVYNYHGDSVIVLPAKSYQEAIDIAIQEFPRLRNVERDDITLSCRVASNGKYVYWRVSQSAWATITETLGSKSVLTVGVRGEDAIAGPASNQGSTEYLASGGKSEKMDDSPPSYLEVPERSLGFKDRQTRNKSKSRSPSPNGVLSNPARSFSRSPPPQSISTKSSFSGFFRRK